MWKWLVKNITEYQIWIKYMFGKHAVYRQKYFNTSLASPKCSILLFNILWLVDFKKQEIFRHQSLAFNFMSMSIEQCRKKITYCIQVQKQKIKGKKTTASLNQHFFSNSISYLSIHYTSPSCKSLHLVSISTLLPAWYLASLKILWFLHHSYYS